MDSPDASGRERPGTPSSSPARWIRRYPVLAETAAAAAAILSYGYLIVRVIPAPWYVPANLAAAGLLYRISAVNASTDALVRQRWSGGRP